MDFSTLSNSDLANATKALMDELHARQTALEDGDYKTDIGVQLDAIHHHFNLLKTTLVGGGTIQPDDGGTDKGDGH